MGPDARAYSPFPTFLFQFMTDSELYDFAIRYDVSSKSQSSILVNIADGFRAQSVNKYAALCEDAFFQSAKTAMLIEKLEQCKKEGRRMLLFSQVSIRSSQTRRSPY